MKLPANYSFTNHIYIHLTEYKQMINSKYNYLCYIEIHETWVEKNEWKRMSLGSFKNFIYKICLEYMYKEDLALNNLQRLICYGLQIISE